MFPPLYYFGNAIVLLLNKSRLVALIVISIERYELY